MLPGNWFLNDKSCISNRHFSTHFQAVNKKIVLHSFQIIAADHYHLQWLSGRRRIAKMTQSCRCWKCWAQLSLLFELKYLNSGHNRLRTLLFSSSGSVIRGEVCVAPSAFQKNLTSARLQGNRLKERRREHCQLVVYGTFFCQENANQKKELVARPDISVTWW